MKHCESCTCDKSPLLGPAELLGVLRRTDRDRDVYRGAHTNRWFVTYEGGETTREAVDALLGCGAIQSKYGPDDYFCIFCISEKGKV
jgi:hypothetical protein